MSEITFIALDWGTSNLRLWAMNANQQVVEYKTSDKGMGKLAQAQFEPTLLELIEPWIGDVNKDKPMPVIACGMVGARQGWHEAPYETVPCSITPKPHNFETRDQRIKLYICSGLMQQNPEDVMRGEETQIAGLLNDQPNFTGAIAMPGTHTKWVNVKEGYIDSFLTVMSGELFALLSKQSVLRHSIQGDGFDEPAFVTAVKEVAAAPEKVVSKFFNIRARSLLTEQGSAELNARLSGLVIGLELMGCKDYWHNEKVSLIGTYQLSKLYQLALEALGASVEIFDDTDLTLKGLTSAFHNIRQL
jgi:2-dehydro-3-deoxygalactonokinase